MKNDTVVKVRWTRSARVMISTAFRAAPGRATVVLVLTVLAALASPLFAYWIKFLVDAAVERDIARVLAFAGALGGTYAIESLFGISGFLLRIGLEERTGLHIDSKLIEATAGIGGIEHHERPEYADQIELLRNERVNLSNTIGSLVENMGMLIRLGSSVALLGTVHPILLLLPLFGIPNVGAGARGQTILIRAEEQLAEMRRKAKHLFDLATTAAPAKEMRVFGLSDHVVSRHRHVLRDADTLAARARLKAAALSSAAWAMFGLGYAGALGFVVVRGIQHGFRGTITIGVVVMAFQLASQVNNQVSGMVNLVAWMMRSLRTAARFVWLMDHARDRRSKDLDAMPVPDRIAHGIDVEGLTFRYPGTETDVLRDATLHIPAGATVAIVGDNGAGKSTLVKLLCRFYEPSGGRITLDGTDLAHFEMEDWRTHLSAGFQDFARFEFVARETVGVGALADIEGEAAVMSALGRASATDVIDTLPRGLETQLGKSFDDGVELSGGQWQKLALGRAMMRRQPLLLVLDEPTAALDAQTEHSLFEQYAVAAREAARTTGAITVLVSHRFSTVRMADLIAVIDEGRVAEFGSHAELMARKGLYAELYELQARAYR